MPRYQATQLLRAYCKKMIKDVKLHIPNQVPTPKQPLHSISWGNGGDAMRHLHLGHLGHSVQLKSLEELIRCSWSTEAQRVPKSSVVRGWRRCCAQR